MPDADGVPIPFVVLFDEARVLSQAGFPEALDEPFKVLAVEPEVGTNDPELLSGSLEIWVEVTFDNEGIGLADSVKL